MARDQERVDGLARHPSSGACRRSRASSRRCASRRALASTCAASRTSFSFTTSRARRSAAPSARCSRPPSPPPTTASSAWTRTAPSRARCSSGRRHRAPAAHRQIKLGSSEGFDDKMRALLHVARTVRRDPLELTAADVAAARVAGATDGDVQLAVLIAVRLLDVQPARRRLPGDDAADARGLPVARGRDRRERLQRASVPAARHACGRDRLGLSRLPARGQPLGWTTARALALGSMNHAAHEWPMSATPSTVTGRARRIPRSERRGPGARRRRRGCRAPARRAESGSRRCRPCSP